MRQERDPTKLLEYARTTIAGKYLCKLIKVKTPEEEKAEKEKNQKPEPESLLPQDT